MNFSLTYNMPLFLAILHSTEWLAILNVCRVLQPTGPM